jgi:hypothetical protein
MSQFHEHCGELPDVSLSRARSVSPSLAGIDTDNLRCIR